MTKSLDSKIANNIKKYKSFLYQNENESERRSQMLFRTPPLGIPFLLIFMSIIMLFIFFNTMSRRSLGIKFNNQYNFSMI